MGISKVRAGEVLGVAGIMAILVAATVLGLGAVSANGPQSNGNKTPKSFTWETSQTVQYLDPAVSYYQFDWQIFENTYEALLWYNGPNDTSVIPWLASAYSVSPDGKTATFTLNSGIKFQDGETLNSTSVYFSLNRLLVLDGSTPTSHGTQAAWILQQLLNSSLSWTLSGPHQYNQAWLNDVLAQNFVQITGTDTFQLNMMNPIPGGLAFILTGEYATILAPDYVMSHDLALWTSQGYTLPYPTLTGSGSTMINEYFQDEIATCNTGPTPNGCGQTYLDTSSGGSLAGTGPYILSSVNLGTNQIVLQQNTHYWGAAPNIPTIYINTVSSANQREIDLINAAANKGAMTVDVPNNDFYSIVNKAAWLTSNAVLPTTTGVSVYGPFTTLGTLFDPFAMNVTDPFTGQYYQFQPFADQRLRLAFADAVNLTDANQNYNNNFGPVPNGLMPPNLPPSGTYDSSVSVAYSYNLNNVYNLLISAMESPITSFTFYDGQPAPQGLFNNTFGCDSNTYTSNGNWCPNPIQRTVPIISPVGDVYDDQILASIASNINQVSLQHNLGLTVTLESEHGGDLINQAFSNHAYLYSLGWIQDYPYSTDFINPMFGLGGSYPQGDQWNNSALQSLVKTFQADAAVGDTAGMVSTSSAIDSLANQMVMYLWTTYIQAFYAMTSNIHGFYFNPALPGIYFAALS